MINHTIINICDGSGEKEYKINTGNFPVITDISGYLPVLLSVKLAVFIIGKYWYHPDKRPAKLLIINIRNNRDTDNY